MSTQWTWFVLKKVEQARPVCYHCWLIWAEQKVFYLSVILLNCCNTKLLLHTIDVSFLILLPKMILLHHRLDLRRCFLVVWGHVTTKHGRDTFHQYKRKYPVHFSCDLCITYFKQWFVNRFCNFIVVWKYVLNTFDENSEGV